MNIKEKFESFKKTLSDKKTYKAYQEIYENKDRVNLDSDANYIYEMNKDINTGRRNVKFANLALMPAIGFASVANGYFAFAYGEPALGILSTAVGALAFGLTGNFYGKAGGLEGIKKEAEERKERNKESFEMAKLHANLVTNQNVFDVPADLYTKEEVEKICSDLLDAENEK